MTAAENQSTENPYLASPDSGPARIRTSTEVDLQTDDSSFERYALFWVRLTGLGMTIQGLGMTLSSFVSLVIKGLTQELVGRAWNLDGIAVYFTHGFVLMAAGTCLIVGSKSVLQLVFLPRTRRK